MLKLSDNPPILSPGVDSLAKLTGSWWIGYTKARFEKVFAWDLLKRDIGYFLPMRERTAYWGSRKRRVMTPLFSSYVFFCGCEKDRYTALTTGRLSRVIAVVDQERLIEELAGIEKALVNKAVIDNYPRLPIGNLCRITSGAMMGIEGVIVERIDSKARMVLEVATLGQGALIEIDADVLEPLGRGAD